MIKLDDVFTFVQYSECPAVEISLANGVDTELESRATRTLYALDKADTKNLYTIDFLADAVMEVSLFFDDDNIGASEVRKDIVKTYNSLFSPEETLYDPLKIIGVAVKHKDLVVVLPKPYRHHDVIGYMVEELNVAPPIGSDGQGFYLEDGTYLDRVKAREYALEIGQVKTTDHSTELFSEDLW